MTWPGKIEPNTTATSFIFTNVSRNGPASQGGSSNVFHLFLDIWIIYPKKMQESQLDYWDNKHIDRDGIFERVQVQIKN